MPDFARIANLPAVPRPTVATLETAGREGCWDHADGEEKEGIDESSASLVVP